jgi:monoterpene epsilon-lactone hydrolase
MISKQIDPLISKEVEEVANWWRKSAEAAPKHASLEAARNFGEGWGLLTAEPTGVDYTETNAGGITALWATPKNAVSDRVIIGLHGGGFFSGSMYTHRKMFAHLAKAIGCRALVLNYSLSPEHPYPAQLNETLSAYRWLLELPIAPKQIAFVGDSAGGNLCITALLKARDQGLPLPAAVLPISPWYDMEVTGASATFNLGKDALFTREWILQIGQMYLGENGPKTDPYVNPLFADLKGLPPIYIQTGGDELLLDDAVRLYERAIAAGVDIKLDVFPHMQHTFQMAVGRAPESNKAIASLAQWVIPKLGLG